MLPQKFSHRLVENKRGSASYASIICGHQAQFIPSNALNSKSTSKLPSDLCKRDEHSENDRASLNEGFTQNQPDILTGNDQIKNPDNPNTLLELVQDNTKGSYDTLRPPYLRPTLAPEQLSEATISDRAAVSSRSRNGLLLNPAKMANYIISDVLSRRAVSVISLNMDHPKFGQRGLLIRSLSSELLCSLLHISLDHAICLTAAKELENSRLLRHAWRNIITETRLLALRNFDDVRQLQVEQQRIDSYHSAFDFLGRNNASSAKKSSPRRSFGAPAAPTSASLHRVFSCCQFKALKQIR